MFSTKARKNKDQRLENQFIAKNAEPGSPLNRQQRRIKMGTVRPMIRKARTRAIMGKLTEKRRAVRDSQQGGRIPPGPRSGKAWLKAQDMAIPEPTYNNEVI